MARRRNSAPAAEKNQAPIELSEGSDNIEGEEPETEETDPTPQASEEQPGLGTETALDPTRSTPRKYHKFL